MRTDQKGHSARFPEILILQEALGGGPGNGTECTLETTGDCKGASGKTSGRSWFPNAPLRATSSCPTRSMSAAIA